MQNKHTDSRKSHSSQLITIKFSEEEYFDLLSAIASAECRAREARFYKLGITGTKEINRFIKLYEKVNRYYKND